MHDPYFCPLQDSRSNHKPVTRNIHNVQVVGISVTLYLERNWGLVGKRLIPRLRLEISKMTISFVVSTSRESTKKGMGLCHKDLASCRS